jgi:ATPase subunit of ABC transporter with duplicated ATPase domains
VVIKAIGVKSGSLDSAIGSETVAYAAKPTVATPVITASTTSPANRETGVTFTIGAVAGVTFYYTTDGSAPTSASSAYSTTVTLTAPDNDALTSVVIKAIGVKSGSLDSAIGSETVAYAAKPTVATPISSPSSGYSAAEAAAIRAANEAAAKAEAEKLAAAKAEADAKAAAEAAAKAAADKAAQEKAAAERAAADKIAAEERAAAEAIVKAEEARVAAAEAKAAASNVKVTSSKSGTKLTLDLADKYFGKIVTVYVGTKKNGKVTYRAIDYFAVDKEDGTASISTKVKLTKGQIIRVNVGKTVIKSLTLK